MRSVLLVLLVLLIAACTKPAPAPPRASTGSATDDEFCADHGQHCGVSSNAIRCCEPLVCVPNTDAHGDVLVHQCVQR